MNEKILVGFWACMVIYEWVIPLFTKGYKKIKEQEEERKKETIVPLNSRILNSIRPAPPPPPDYRIKKQKIYIAGKIKGNPNFKEDFATARRKLEEQGYIVLDPSLLPAGMEYEDYMTICYAMIDTAKQIKLLHNWKDSPGANREKKYAESKLYRVTEME